MNWTKAKPASEVWYFWRKRKDQSDPFYWLTYFYCDKLDASGRVSWWADGTEVTPPRGGEYSPIFIGNAKHSGPSADATGRNTGSANG